MPLAFIEVKKPNNQGGIAAERNRINERFSNPKFRRFINITQLMIFSNNQPYDDTSPNSLQGAFYATTAMGSDAKVKFNHFREQLPVELVEQLRPIDESVEAFILKDNNTPVLKASDEYQTNLDDRRPTNSLITSLLSRPRLEFILKYAFAFVHSTGVVQRHIMRYPQLFATKAIANTLDKGIRKGVIWHTQGSGKTALAYYNVKFLTEYYAKQGKITKFYFIVDRLDLLTQASQEFQKRGLKVRTVTSKQELVNEFASSNVSHSGENEICVINIQKFRDDTEAINKSGYDDINIQRIYFIDEAHRSYDPRGSYLANLYQSDTDSIKIALTGTPLIIYNEHSSGDDLDGNLSQAQDRKTTVAIFGDYIHKYYYTDSIRDGYTLRLLREDIETSYRRDLRNLHHQLSVQQGELRKRDLYAHEKYVAPLLSYIVNDFNISRVATDDRSIGGMIVCHSSEQAREVFKQAQANYPELKFALILHDEGDKASRKQQTDDFKAGNIDILIVFNMLLTGFDAPRLKRLYLCRVIRAHNLLQALTRVNRPYGDFRMGYIVDFADIHDEFEQTNEHYLAELKNEYQSGVDDSDGNVFGSLFIEGSEIEKQIRQITEDLAGYDTANAENFSTQISQLRDRHELNQLSKSLSDARGLYNIIRLTGHHDLLDKLDFKRLNYELHEVNNRLDLVRAQDALDNPGADRQMLLNVAIENVVFDFHKVGEEELRMEEATRAANNYTRDIRHELGTNYDQGDPEFIDIDTAFRELLRKSSIEHQTLESLNQTVGMLQKLLERAIALNRRNKQRSASYNGDIKFAKADRQITSLINEPSVRHNFLSEVKQSIDNKISLNKNLMSNADYFRAEVRQSVNQEDDIGLDRSARVFTSDTVSDFYIKQYLGKDD